MAVWQNSVMESFYGDNTEMDIGQCDVRIDDGRIEIRYEDELGQEMTYRGVELAPGHFSLEGAASKATLHRFPDSKILEGWWNEDGSVGMWRIILSKGEA